MSNSIRWTAADLERYEKRSGVILHQPVKPVKKYSKNIPDYPKAIKEALRQLGIEAVSEYRFCHERRFRFDLAIPALKIAIEVNGGSFKKGNSGHSSGKGIIRDAKKANLAVMHGWKLFTYTTADTTGDLWEYKIAGEIERFIKQQKEQL